MPDTEPNKSDFVRSHPTLNAAKIVAKAKEAGITITPGLVYAVRSVEKRKKKGKAKKAAPAAAPSPKKADGKLSASEFIRQQPAAMKATEVAAAGGKAGFNFRPSFVYTVRAQAKRRRAKGNRATPAAGQKPTAAGGSSHKADLRRLVVLVGLEQAEALFAEVRKEFLAFSSGK